MQKAGSTSDSVARMLLCAHRRVTYRLNQDVLDPIEKRMAVLLRVSAHGTQLLLKPAVAR